MAHEVFISHSAQNKEVADTICAALEKAGIHCWVAPRDVRPGRSFPGEITRAIQKSKVMLLIFSRHSNNSEQVLREVQLATDSRLPLVRFRIEDVSMNDDLKYFLSTPHWLDALTEPLADHIARLETAIKELLSQSVEVSGKNVVDVGSQPAGSPATSFAAPPVAPSAPPPPIPKTPTPARPVEAFAPSSTKAASPPRRSATPWLLLGIAAVTIFAGVVCIAVVISLQHSNVSEQGSVTVQSQSSQSSPAAQSPAPSPARVVKVKQKTNAPQAVPAKAPKTKTESSDSNETENQSAFDRAGSLKRRDEPVNREEDKPANAFDRAGSGIGSDDEPEPSPEEE